MNADDEIISLITEELLKELIKKAKENDPTAREFVQDYFARPPDKRVELVRVQIVRLQPHSTTLQ